MLENAENIDGVACVVCLGYFDGVHLGHQKLIDAANEVKAKYKAISCVHTYREPPILLIRPGTEYAEITSLDEKIDLLKKNGADEVIVDNFTKEIMLMGGEEFIVKVLMRKLNLKHIVVGYNHRFGYKGRTGTSELKEICDKLSIGFSVVEPVMLESGMLVSSTNIKQLILNGDTSLAEDMLGRKLDAKVIDRVRMMTGEGRITK